MGMAARAGRIGRVTEVLPVAESLRRALERIYSEKSVTISVDCEDGVKFQGEKQDLEEMLGNLMDNGCKWAASKVYLIAKVAPTGMRSARRRLIIEVEDDGNGLTEE